MYEWELIEKVVLKKWVGFLCKILIVKVGFEVGGWSLGFVELMG